MVRTTIIGLFMLLLGSGASITRADRVLHFPEDRSLGWLTVHDGPVHIDGAGFLGNQWHEGWTSFGVARGDVVIPDGTLVWLTLSSDMWYDPEQLSALKGLDPNALFGLSTYSSVSGVLKPNDRCMPYIAHLTGLRLLNMWTTNVTDKGAEHLTNLKALEWLSFGSRISNSGLSFVAAMPSLRGLQLSPSNHIDEALLSLGRLDSLEALALNGNMVSDDDLQYLANFPALQQLRLWGELSEGALVHLPKASQLDTLWLESDGSISEDEMSQVASLEKLKRLKIRSQLNDQACTQLAQLTQLEELSLAYTNEISDEGISHLAGLGSLRKLSLGMVTLTDQGFESLAQLSHLESLSVRVPELSGKGLRHLASMENLKTLTLAIKTLSSHGFSVGESVRSLKQLEDLSLYMPVSEQDIAAISDIQGLRRLSVQLKPGATNRVFSELGKLNGLRYLSIDCKSQVSTGGLAHLNGLSNLEKLYVRSLKRDATAMDISGLVSLTSLSIQMNFERQGKNRIYEHFKNDDLACLAGLTRLKRLQLNSPGIGDEGIAHLATLKDLNFISVIDSSISDKGLYHLSQLDSLSQIIINGGEFTDKGIAYLQDLRPLATLTLTSNQGISNKAINDLQEKLPSLTRITIDSPQLTMK